LKQGDALHIPKRKVHSMWNHSGSKTVVNWKVRPAMDTEYFLETATGLANDGKTNAHGMPNILQTALMANKYADVFRLAKPPYAVQKIVFILLSPPAYLFGYRPFYKKYID
ncbi:MAG: cupin domain-containing protein, partial [Saprospiraceae bacterium]|nr:cupin domain-containing protein [Saprospiraceae bacterium]